MWNTKSQKYPHGQNYNLFLDSLQMNLEDVTSKIHQKHNFYL